MAFKILLFGRSGQLADACLKALPAEGRELVALDRQAADFASPDAVAAAVREQRPDFVVNACAYTAVDRAESESELAHTVNGDSVGALGRACAELGVPCIHVSTDYVFDGRGSEPYREHQAVAPQGVYGASKLAGERQLAAANPRHIILRTSWVFGAHGNNFVKTMLRLGAEREELGVVADQQGCPTYTADLAAVIERFIELWQSRGDLPWGVYHCSNAGPCSWFEFAGAIFDEGVAAGLLTRAPRVRPITTDQYPTPAARPAYSIMDCSKLEQTLGIRMPHWRDGLQAVCQTLAD